MLLSRRFLVGSALTLPVGVGYAQNQVGTALVLAADASGSVDEDRYKLQMEGYREALLSQEVLELIPRDGLGLCFYEWAKEQRITAPWCVVRYREDMEVFCKKFYRNARSSEIGGNTHLGDALWRAQNLLGMMPFSASRRVVDVSGDGRADDEDYMQAIRQELIKDGVIINGLPIFGSESGIDLYYRSNVIGGLGSFAEVAVSYKVFKLAVRRKLLREIA